MKVYQKKIAKNIGRLLPIIIGRDTNARDITFFNYDLLHCSFKYKVQINRDMERDKPSFVNMLPSFQFRR